MFRVLNSKGLFVFAAVAFLVFFALQSLMSVQSLMYLLNGVFLGIVGAVTITFFPLFWESLKAKKLDRVTQMLFGIILTWCALIVLRIMSVYFNITPEADRVDQYSNIAFATYLAIVGGVLHVTAPGMVADKLKYNKGILLLAVIVGLSITAFTVYIQSK